MACRFCGVSLLICTSLWSTAAGDKLAVQYRILEEQPAFTVVGNVAADVQLDTVYSKDELAELRYHLIAVVWSRPLSNDHEELSHFTLNADSGLLTTSKAMLYYVIIKRLVYFSVFDYVNC